MPRGTGVVTRRPLILQMVKNSSEDEYAEFLNIEGKEVTRYCIEKVKQEIERDTNRVAGTDKGICREPIRLRICSPNVLDLTIIIDLPGVTKIPIGDQPSNIEQQVWTTFVFHFQPVTFTFTIRSSI